MDAGNGADPAVADVEVRVEGGRHVWTLGEWPVTRLSFDESGVRLEVRKRTGSAEIRIEGRLRLDSGDATVVLDPAETEGLAPLLGVLGRPLRRVVVGPDGTLELTVGGWRIEVRPDPRFGAWEAQGEGAFDGLAYACPAGGGAPWSAA